MFAAYMDMRYSRNMSRDEAREKVIPTYMGLITQIDDQMGVLMRFLEERGLLDTTMIVFTSDHGDYLGDHWMGEKDLFHDQSAKIPLIVIDPVAGGRRHARHGLRCAGRGDRPRADLHRLFRRHAARPHPRGPLAAAAAARRDAGRLAQGRVLRIRLRDAGRPAEAQPADRSLPAVHGVRRPLEIHPRLRLSPDAVRSRERSAGIRRSRRRSGMRRDRSRGCRPRCSTGRCIRRTHHDAATRRSRPMPTTSCR